MLYLRQFLIVLCLACLFPSPCRAIDPFSAFLIGKGADKALDLLFSGKDDTRPGMRESLNAAGTFAGGAWELAFGKDGEHASLAMIAGAKKSILVAASSIKSAAMARELEKAAQRGVKVLVVTEKRQGSNYIPMLARSGVPVRIRSGKTAPDFMVLDGKSAQDGLPGNSARILCLKNEPQLARAYARKWKQLWDEGKTVNIR